MGRGTLGVVLDGSTDSLGGLGWVGPGDAREGPGRVGGPLGRSATDRGTLGVVLDGSTDSLGGLGRAR